MSNPDQIKPEIKAILDELFRIAHLSEYIEKLKTVKGAVVREVKSVNKWANHVWLKKDEFPEGLKVLVVKL